LNDVLIEVTGRFTQWSITLAGGALALSMTYVEKLQPETSAGRWILVCAWVALLLSLVVSLVCLLLGIKSTELAIDVHDADIGNWLSDVESDSVSDPNKFSCWIRGLSVTSVFTFATGIVFIAIFVALCPPSHPTPKQENVKANTTTNAATTDTNATQVHTKP